MVIFKTLCTPPIQYRINVGAVTRFNVQKLTARWYTPRDFMLYPNTKPLINLPACTAWTRAKQVYTMRNSSTFSSQDKLAKSLERKDGFRSNFRITPRICDSRRSSHDNISSILHVMVYIRGACFNTGIVYWGENVGLYHLSCTDELWVHRWVLYFFLSLFSSISWNSDWCYVF